MHKTGYPCSGCTGQGDCQDGCKHRRANETAQHQPPPGDAVLRQRGPLTLAQRSAAEAAFAATMRAEGTCSQALRAALDAIN